MATIAVAAIAAKAAAGAGAAGLGAGASVGFSLAFGAASYFDSQFILPRFIKQRGEGGDPLGGANVSTVGFNGPINWAIGQQYRLAGNLIWEGPETPIEERENSGSKGGQSGNFVTYRYKRDVAYLIQETDGIEIGEIEALRLNENLVYIISDEIDITDPATSPNKFEVEIIETYSIDPSNPSSTTTTYSDFARVRSDPALGGADLSVFRTGQQIFVTGETTFTVLNGTFTVTNAGVFPNSTETYVTYKVRERPGSTSSIPDRDTSSTGDTYRLFQNASGFSGRQFDEIEIFKGSDSQLPSQIMEAVLGSGEVPAYRNKVIVVLRQLDLQDYGNVTPSCEAQVSNPNPFNVSDAIVRIMRRWGIPDAAYDVSGVSERFQGLIVQGPQTAADMLQSILLTYDVLHRDVDGLLVFYDREDTPSFTIETDDLAAAPIGTSVDFPHKVTPRTAEDDQVSTMFLTHYDTQRDYQQGTVTYRRPTQNTGVVESLNLPLVINRTKAFRTAARIVHQNVLHSREVELNLPPSYLVDLRENTNCSYTAQGTTWNLLTQSIERSPGFIFRVRAVEDDVSLSDWRFAADLEP